MSPKTEYNVLISASGGDVGQAIIKSLKITDRNIRCHGCDIEDNGIGKLLLDSFHIAPPAKDPGYLDAIDFLSSDLGVDAFIPASEQEILALCNAGFMQKLPCGIPVICQDKSTISVFGDKLQCMENLKGHHIPLAHFADGLKAECVEALVDTVGFPLVVKERMGRGSKSFFVVKTKNELIHALNLCEKPLVQEFIDDMYGEFSIGIFSDGNTIEMIAFRRLLGLTGASWFAETTDDQDVLEYAKKIANLISPLGSINIQVRKSSRGVRLLEINPRFSSLTAARAICGFNDVLWSLDLSIHGKKLQKTPKIKNIHFKRYISEMIDFGDGYETVPEWQPNKRNRNK
jgi:carbamoyl-phosphate synthase large subunit